MARPVLTEYLLKLSTNQSEFDRFRTSRAEAVASMTEAGLSEEQRKIVLRADSSELSDAVNKELQLLQPKLDTITKGPLQVTTIGIQFAPPLVTHSEP
jgi:hypothetical protein